MKLHDRLYRRERRWSTPLWPCSNLRSIARFVLVTILAVSLPARADWLSWTHAGPGDALELRPSDAVLAPALIAGWGGLEVLPLSPGRCRLCDGFDDAGLPGSAGAGRGSLNGVDAAFHDALSGWVVSRGSADTLSSVIAYGVTPGFALGTALFATGPRSSSGAGVRATVIVVESAAASGIATGVLKIAFARKRPYVRYGTGTVGGAYDVSGDDSRASFVSGHVSAVAALGTSAAMCATLQDEGAAPALWAAAGTLTVLTGALRMVAEKHYFTDVLGGAAVGAAAGLAVPLLHRKGVQVLPNGLAYSF